MENFLLGIKSIEDHKIKQRKSHFEKGAVLKTVETDPIL